MTQASDHIVLRSRPEWLEPMLPKLFGCRERILAVTDSLDFQLTSTFGLGQFLNDLRLITPEPEITTVVRASSVPPFVFDDNVTRENFDQIWLFGWAGAPLAPREISILYKFMESGGGVFATGDHEDLGYALCGELPRVRKMREWQKIPAGGVDRIDTMTNPGPDHIPDAFDQADEFPQRIFPHYSQSGSTWLPHPLLRSPLADIDVLPDHPHESVCLPGADLDELYTLHGLKLVEFPTPVNGRRPLSPRIIASSVSAGRYLADIGKPPTTPRLFGAISVWDGHVVDQGRIVCDATWHHFLNFNLSGTGAIPGRLGLAPEPRAQIGEYFRNIVDWLVPQDHRWCKRWVEAVVERYRFPLFEEFKPLPKASSWEERLALGRIVEPALEAVHGHGYTAELVAEALSSAQLESWRRFVLEEPGSADRDGDTDRTAALAASSLVLADEIRIGVAGAVFDALVSDLPAGVGDLATVLEGHDDQGIAEAVVQATSDAMDSARRSYAERAKRTLSLFDDGFGAAFDRV